jgi:hypothetical protein
MHGTGQYLLRLRRRSRWRGRLVGEKSRRLRLFPSRLSSRRVKVVRKVGLGVLVRRPAGRQIPGVSHLGALPRASRARQLHSSARETHTRTRAPRASRMLADTPIRHFAHVAYPLHPAPFFFPFLDDRPCRRLR